LSVLSSQFSVSCHLSRFLAAIPGELRFVQPADQEHARLTTDN
jgi:hypothetical protein